MSIKLMSKVWEITLPPTPKLVLMALADCANDEGFRVFPSIETIAAKTCISPRQAQRIMQDLMRDGFIRIIAHEQGGRGRAREYAINLEALEKGDMQKGDILSSGEERVTSDAQKGDICDSKRVTSTSPQPSSNNHQIKLQDSPPISPPNKKSFEDFWPLCPPTHCSKKRSRKAWDAACLIAAPEDIIAGMRAYAEFLSQHPDPPTPQHPSTWLNNEGWTVDYTATLEAALLRDRQHRRRVGKETDEERLARLSAEMAAEDAARITPQTP